MKIASFNINSVRARLPNLLAWLQENAPELVCLQELKCEFDQFPFLELKAAGYDAQVVGQKAYNGVAVLHRAPVRLTHTQLPSAPDDAARFIQIETESGLRVANIYAPNGNPMGTEKFAYKLAWLTALEAHLKAEWQKRTPFLVCGDFNIIPHDVDCYDPKAWAGDALFQAEVKSWYQSLLHFGFVDAFRALHPTARHAYTFWDYQAGAWQHNLGIRIDHFLLNPEAADALVSCTIDKKARGAEKASDHTPIVACLGALK